MKRRREACKIIGIFRHETDELFPQYDDAIIDLWRTLPDSILERNYHHEGCSVSLRFNWDPLVQTLTERRERTSRFKANPGTSPRNWSEVLFTKAQCSCSVEVSGKNALSEYGWYASFFAASHLYDSFLILNLALPGSAKFSSVKVSSFDEKFHEDFDTSAYYFEDSWIRSESGDWPSLRLIPAATVADWFKKVRPGFNQIPENSIESALFALLYICRSTGRPEDVIWLFYAMESLFETKPGENFAALYERLCLILDPPNEVGSRLRKELRRLYDYRSSFVHGGLPVIHPHHQEQMDRRVDDRYGDIVELSLRWTYILIACLQRIATEQWSQLMFRTKLVAN